jgi:hypothetical protein
MQSPRQEVETSGPHDKKHASGGSLRFTHVVRTLTGLSVSVSLLVFLGIATEFVSMAGLAYRAWSLREWSRNRFLHVKFYENKEWAREYWRENTAASSQFEFTPYILWRKKPFSGRYVNVDADGNRRTVNPDCSPKACRIWMFGGSSLWGAGAKDDETIPSILSKEYSRSKGAVCITNFGEAGWVSTQGVIQLEIALKRTLSPPDLVLFYDGYTDAFSPYASGRNDFPLGFEQLRDTVEENGQEAGLAYLKATNTYRLIGVCMNKLLSIKAQGQTGSKPVNTVNLFAHMAADNYLKNLMLLQSLSDRYGFRYEAYWTPLLFLGNRLFWAEHREMLHGDEQVSPGFSETLQKTHDLIFSAANPHVHDLTDIFDQTHEEVFVDLRGHTNPLGNRIVARRILETIVKSDMQH